MAADLHRRLARIELKMGPPPCPCLEPPLIFLNGGDSPPLPEACQVHGERFRIVVRFVPSPQASQV